MKLEKPSFDLIPKLTKTPNYHVDVSWTQLEFWLEGQKKDYGLDLEPDFQRAHVWSKDKQIAYVEFCLREGKSSRDIYFNCPAYGNHHEKRKSDNANLSTLC